MIFVSNDQLLKVSKIVASALVSLVVVAAAIFILLTVVGFAEPARNTLVFVEQKWPHVCLAIAVNAILIYDVLSILLWRLGIHREDVQFRWKHHPWYGGDAPSKVEIEKWEKEILILPHTPTSDKYFIYPLIFALSLIFLFLVDSNSNYKRPATASTSNFEMFTGNINFRFTANAR